MTDCRMVGLDWRDTTYYEWQAIVWNWNDRHNPDGGKPSVPVADPDKVRAAMERLRDRRVNPPATARP